MATSTFVEGIDASVLRTNAAFRMRVSMSLIGSAIKGIYSLLLRAPYMSVCAPCATLVTGAPGVGAARRGSRDARCEVRSVKCEMRKRAANGEASPDSPVLTSRFSFLTSPLGLPARLDDAGQPARRRQFAEADAADAELP